MPRPPRRSTGDGIGVPVGFICDELVGYLPRGAEDELQYPLLALDLGTDRVRSLVDGYGTYADVLPTADGSPVLVYDAPDADSPYTLRTTDGSRGSRLLWSSDQDHTDSVMGDFGTNSMVGTDEWRGRGVARFRAGVRTRRGLPLARRARLVELYAIFVHEPVGA